MNLPITKCAILIVFKIEYFICLVTSTSASAQPNDISKLQCGHSVNIAPRTIQICALFKPIFSFRLFISGDVISINFYTWHFLCSYAIAVEANLMLLPVCTLNFVLGNTSMLFWKIYLDESLWCIVSVTHCSFPLLLVCCCFLSFCVAKLEELGQNGNDILLQIVGCSIIKYFAQFVGFVISPNVPYCCILFL